jgi:hypothetical protein
MRRNLTSIILFSLALAVQVIAPATAGLAHAALAPGQICASFVEASVATSAAPAGHAEAGSPLCDLCALCCCGGAAATAPAPQFTGVRAFDWSYAEWTAAARRPIVFRPDHARRARAPPLTI